MQQCGMIIIPIILPIVESDDFVKPLEKYMANLAACTISLMRVLV
jgi:hypothetical protein